MKHRLESLDVVLNSAGRLRCDPHWSLDSQWAKRLRDYDLWYIWAGRGRMTTSDGVIDLHPGRGLWMRPGRRYEAEQDPQERLGVTFIHFRLKTCQRVLAISEFTPPIESFETHHPDYFNAALEHVTRSKVTNTFPESTALLVKSLLLEATTEARQTETTSGPERHHREAIARSVAYIQEHPEGQVPVAKLAQLSGYSLDHFSRIFHEITGEAPKDYLLRARMERAMTLLRESSQTISQVADVLGYRDTAFFSRQFKQKLGVSPAQFRRPSSKA